MSSKSLNWTSGGFRELNLDSLYDILALRCKVFIVEQGPYLDVDGLDQHSWHLLGRDESGELLLYLRVVDPGLKYDEPSIGRVVIDKRVRGTGLGRVMMGEAVRRCDEAWPGRANRISAQAHLARFYGEFGYVPVGEPYLEDNIPHQEMLRQP